MRAVARCCVRVTSWGVRAVVNGLDLSRVRDMVEGGVKGGVLEGTDKRAGGSCGGEGGSTTRRVA